MQSPALTRVIEQDNGLRSTESFSFRVSLNETTAPLSSIKLATPREFITNRLSRFFIRPNIIDPKCIPNLSQLGSFLMKHETKFIGILGQPGNNEEFHKIISVNDQHMTVIITWKALVNDNSSTQRITYGQHFIQLRNLYET